MKMKSNWLWLVISGCLISSRCGGALYTYDFGTGETAAPTASGLSFGSFARQNVTAATQTGVFTSSAWTTGVSQDVGEYVQFTISLTGGGQFTLSSLSFYMESKKANGNGNDGGPNQLTASVFAGLLSPGSGNGNTPLTSQSWNNVQNTKQTLVWDLTDQTTTTALTVRFFGWGAESENGILMFDNVVVDGTLSPVPEPVTTAGIVFGLLFLGLKLIPFRRIPVFRKTAPHA